MNDDIIYADSYDFDDRIEYGVKLAFFYAEWCVQSRGLIPILEDIADEYYDYIRIVAVDIEQSPDVASVFAGDQTPTVIFFKNGRLAERINGSNPPNAYIDVIEDLIE